MQETIAYGTVAITLGLVLSRPRLGWLRIGPGSAGLLGLCLLLVAGVVAPADIVAGFQALWRPLLTITAIMMTTAVASRLAILEHFARALAPRPGQSIGSTFAWVFALSALTSAILNNDAAVLLLTPLVVGLVRRSYPERPDRVIPFAFAVFSAAGVAPLVISNPMNLVVADYARIGFNDYAARMIPISLIGSITTFLILRAIFARQLRWDPAERPAGAAPPRSLPPHTKQFLALMAVALGSYPALSYAGGPIWAVAAASAVLAVILAWHHGLASPGRIVAMVSWDILVFLLCVFVIVLGLRNVGLVDRIVGLYQAANSPSTQIIVLGTSSAVGSALLNNHPMAILNAMALRELPGATQQHVLAALIGGDLGPRFLPIGSLAGLLWLDSLRRLAINVKLVLFVLVGVAVTVPTLILSLVLLILGSA
jgi:arsenical pump membrane protein